MYSLLVAGLFLSAAVPQAPSQPSWLEIQRCLSAVATSEWSCAMTTTGWAAIRLSADDIPADWRQSIRQFTRSPFIHRVHWSQGRLACVVIDSRKDKDVIVEAYSDGNLLAEFRPASGTVDLYRGLKDPAECGYWPQAFLGILGSVPIVATMERCRSQGTIRSVLASDGSIVLAFPWQTINLRVTFSRQSRLRMGQLDVLNAKQQIVTSLSVQDWQVRSFEGATSETIDVPASAVIKRFVRKGAAIDEKDLPYIEQRVTFDWQAPQVDGGAIMEAMHHAVERIKDGDTTVVSAIGGDRLIETEARRMAANLRRPLDESHSAESQELDARPESYPTIPSWPPIDVDGLFGRCGIDLSKGHCGQAAASLVSCFTPHTIRFSTLVEALPSARTSLEELLRTLQVMGLDLVGVECRKRDLLLCKHPFLFVPNWERSHLAAGFPFGDGQRVYTWHGPSRSAVLTRKSNNLDERIVCAICRADAELLDGSTWPRVWLVIGSLLAVVAIVVGVRKRISRHIVSQSAGLMLLALMLGSCARTDEQGLHLLTRALTVSVASGAKEEFLVRVQNSTESEQVVTVAAKSCSCIEPLMQECSIPKKSVGELRFSASGDQPGRKAGQAIRLSGQQGRWSAFVSVDVVTSGDDCVYLPPRLCRVVAPGIMKVPAAIVLSVPGDLGTEAAPIVHVADEQLVVACAGRRQVRDRSEPGKTRTEFLFDVDLVTELSGIRSFTAIFEGGALGGRRGEYEIILHRTRQ